MGGSWLVMLVAVMTGMGVLAGPVFGASDVTPPDTTVAVPGAGQSLPAGAVTFSGRATDDTAVSRVNIAIQDRATNKWLGPNGTWGAYARFSATLASPGARDTGWTFSFNASVGSYSMLARAVDSAGNLDPTYPWVSFAVRTPSADGEAPDATIASPAAGATVPFGQVTVTGAATDNVAVASVQVGVQRVADGAWLQPGGSWSAGQVLQAATLAAPLATATAWTFAFSPGGAGDHRVTVVAGDSSGNTDQSPAERTFTVASPPDPGSGKPNLVLILTDDQRFDTLDAMPQTRALIAGEGVTFVNGVVANSLCCPSRATILKGAYSHSTGVYDNDGTYGPFPAFNDASTLATWLDGAGYRTALTGKYFNGYDATRAAYVPPGWDRWAAFAVSATSGAGGAYYNYDLSVDGTLRHYGSTANDYSTDVLADYAEDAVRTTPAGQPLFLAFTPYGPHGPATPAPRHVGLYADLAPFRPPSYNESDVSDKPNYIKNLPSITSPVATGIDNLRRNQYRSLRSVDEAVAGIVEALAETGRLSNTMIVFTSDNGFAWGEHRWGQTAGQNKMVSYEESIKVPFLVRYDPVTTAARTSTDLVSVIDIAPTFAALAGVAAPGAEGRSLTGRLGPNPTGAWRQDLLVEHMDRGGVGIPPTYCQVRSTTHSYVQYRTGEEELYELGTDPWQLVNRVTDSASQATLEAMRQRTHELCIPTPPRFTFSH